MMLSPREVEKLYIYVVADLARKRRERGLKLNYSEAIALRLPLSRVRERGSGVGRQGALMAEPVHYIVPDGEIELNAGRPTVTVQVKNTGDRPVQVGSHYHFFEANRELEFDRRAAYGMRLDIPAGTAVRFEPGDEREVPLVAIGGARRAIGFAALVDGDLDDVEGALARAREQDFLGADSPLESVPLEGTDADLA